MLNKIKIVMVILSLIYSQEFDPETGQEIKKNFDPQTGQYIEEKTNPNTIKNEANIFPHDFNGLLNFDNIYFSETMYMKNGFWSPYYIYNGVKISRREALEKLKNFPKSNEMYIQLGKNKSLGYMGCGIMLLSPFFAEASNNGFIGLIGVYTGMFTIIYSSIKEANLVNKAFWIFNREGIKSKYKEK